MDDNEDLSTISDSIFLSVKRLIGISDEDNSFDVDIMLNINAAISTLFQLGVIEKPYTIISEDDTYNDLIPGGSEDVINQTKMYLVYKTKLGFDSSTLSGNVIETLKEMIKEAEWRLMASTNRNKSLELGGDQKCINIPFVQTNSIITE